MHSYDQTYRNVQAFMDTSCVCLSLVKTRKIFMRWSSPGVYPVHQDRPAMLRPLFAHTAHGTSRYGYLERYKHLHSPSSPHSTHRCCQVPVLGRPEQLEMRAPLPVQHE